MLAWWILVLLRYILYVYNTYYIIYYKMYIYSFLTRACRKEIYIYTQATVWYVILKTHAWVQDSNPPNPQKLLSRWLHGFPLQVQSYHSSSLEESWRGGFRALASRTSELVLATHQGSEDYGASAGLPGAAEQKPRFELKSMWKQRWKITMAIFEKEYSIWGLKCLTKNVWMVLGKCREE